MVNLREYSKTPELLAPGHRLCPGCPLSIIARAVMRATDKPIVVTTATGCLEVSTTVFPYTSWRVPWIHNAFENAAATASGIEAAYLAMKKKGKIAEEVKFIVFAGDGGTYDIGLQSLSGMIERGHNIMYVCMDNEGYQNTGAQRSSSTPYGAWTNTTPVGKGHKGKEQFRKDLALIIEGHHIPYVAQASPHNFADLIRKAQKALATEGPTFLNVLSPCVPGWKYPESQTIKIAKLAVETCFWPLFEVDNDSWTLNYDPEERKKPVIEWLKTQKRFSHLMKPENQPIVDKIQKQVDDRWQKLRKRCADE